ncbi:MAG TPA: glycosyltransferase [Actinomycetota bacterium]
MAMMLTPVPLPPKSLGDYASVSGRDLVAGLRVRAAPFNGVRILHINSTAFGGGVAELLHTLIPLQRDLGMEADWRVIQGHEPFFNVTKAMHNALQGAAVPWDDAMMQEYARVNLENAEALDTAYDFIVVHDAQPAGMIETLAPRYPNAKWIWRCHIDLTEVYEPVWQFVKAKVERYDAVVFTMNEFVRPDLKTAKVFLIMPTIDPLSLKNVALEPDMLDAVLTGYGIDASRPMLLQVSRFDPWKDPFGVIDAYRLVKESVPDAILVLAGSMAHDDPEGVEYWQKTAEHAAGDPDIHMLSNVDGVGNIEINAFQRSADVVIQKSLREGFGLTVAEAMWKSKPVIGGNVGGIRAQIQEGRTGYLVSSAEDCADRALTLLRDADAARAMGAAARDSVRERFLSTRWLDDFIGMLESLS